MLSLALLAGTSTAIADTVFWYCQNTASKQEFTLTYDQRGRSISHVGIFVMGTPRLSSDIATRWRAKVTHGGAEFIFDDKALGHWGEMQLTYNHPHTDRSRLRWRDIVWLRGHVPLESKEQVAECRRRG